MTPARLVGPAARQAELDRAREQVGQLMSSADPLDALRVHGSLDTLGVRDSSPFWGGRSGSEELVAELLPAVGALPVLESGASRPALPCSLAVLGDPQLAEILQGSADLQIVDPDDWESAVAPADAVLLSPQTVKSPRARGRVIAAAREASIPLIYLDLTLPVPQPPEIRLAARCDVVLAVSDTAAEEYRGGVPASVQVAELVHPISPLRRSPLGSRQQPMRLVSHLESRRAGALDKDARCSLQWIHDGVIASGSQLLIDENVHGRGAWRHRTPVRHRPHLAPSARTLVSELDRLAPVSVVTQEVAGSQTFFSPRTLDLLASSSLVLSTYNQGLNSHYPEVHIANSAEDVAAGLEELHLEELRRAQGDGVRHAFRRHHAVDVLREALRIAGLRVPDAADRVLAVTTEDERADQLLAEELQVQQSGAVELVSWSELPGREGTFDVLLPVSARRRYSPTYVDDHLAALSYQSAPVTGKIDADSAEAADRHAHRDLEGPGLSADRAWPAAAPDGPLTDISLSAWLHPDAARLASPEALCAGAGRIHLQDHLGHHLREPGLAEIHVRSHETTAAEDSAGGPAEDTVRRAPSALTHGEDLEAVRGEVARTAAREDLDLSVIVPVYNNGEHLRHKAFASLRRSTVFDQMHILLIDDGSTDPVTLDTVEELTTAHRNVSSFHHARGGSGSASRPRNTGLELAQTPYLTYLDPDNEAIEDGYARLYEEITAHPDVDFVLGNMSQWARRHTRLPYAGILAETFAAQIEEDGSLAVPDRALETLSFRPLGIQTVVARTDWLKGLGISQPPGAVGQDSYFFQQMLHYAHRIRTLDVGVHTYYMAVSNSTINTLNPSYFKKYLPLDSARARWLDEVGLLEAYRRDRLERFLVSWHLPKLKKVRPEEWYEAAENLAELLACYGEHVWTDPAALEFWDDLEEARRSSAKRR
ncbi:glycosyltransferase [Nesterenkonia xinjiangensis]|uniref:Glycosyltransferase involved in cell wall biosynthesis n=1 Tax=Nesterenkonia xinjiangensis TaxID=225327 RepID=A0A7Z0GPW0_9MICC|nr:glycosyltransferase involved in cell wall biosynthesis [Nesterenkonia xinjiangensis]